VLNQQFVPIKRVRFGCTALAHGSVRWILDEGDTCFEGENFTLARLLKSAGRTEKDGRAERYRR